VEEIAHRVNEDEPRSPPALRLLHALGAKREIEAGLEGVAGDAAKTLREALGVAAITAGAEWCSR
jgi:hypothetical protein